MQTINSRIINDQRIAVLSKF